MKCMKCGNQLPDDAIFCNKCGINVKEEQKKQEEIRKQGFTEEAIITILNKHQPIDYFYVKPNIPPKKLVSAVASFKVPDSEEPIGLIDNSILGNVKDGLIFGRKGIYFHNNGACKTPGVGFIAYSDFPDCEFSPKSLGDMYLGLGIYFYCTTIKKDKLKLLFLSIKDLSMLIYPMNEAGKTKEVFDENTIVSILNKHQPGKGFYVDPTIPDNKLKNAIESCAVPASEKILGLIDTTITGSAKDCLLFGKEGIYFHNPKKGKTPGAGKIEYKNFVDCEFSLKPWFNIYLGHGLYLTEGGGDVSNEKKRTILLAIKKAATGEA